MLRAAMYQDCITAAAASLYQTLSAERGDLLAQKSTIATLVFDLLTAIGLPHNAIDMVMGHDVTAIEPTPELEIHLPLGCCLCGDYAVHLVETLKGPRAICFDCMPKAQVMGLKILA